MLNVVAIREKNVVGGRPFKFAQVHGTPADHASWWSFDDEQIVRDRWWRPRAGETVLDIGAAFGSYALPALALGARVVCFNPADFDAELLEKNLSLNPELEARCRIVRVGLHGSNGWFDPDKSVFSPDAGAGVAAPELFGMVGNREDGGAGAPKNLMRVRSLDSFMSENPGIDRVDWMKLDVEGAEEGVLRGGAETIRRYKPRILVELHKFLVPDIELKVSRLLHEEMGYQWCDGPHEHGAVSHALFQVAR